MMCLRDSGLVRFKTKLKKQNAFNFSGFGKEKKGVKTVLQCQH